MEDRGFDISVSTAVQQTFIRSAVVCFDKFIYDRSTAGSAFVYAGNCVKEIQGQNYGG